MFHSDCIVESLGIQLQGAMEQARYMKTLRLYDGNTSGHCSCFTHCCSTMTKAGHREEPSDQQSSSTLVATVQKGG
jgi:hypothetical protein